MLTRSDYKKLGIPYADQSMESDRIDFYAQQLNSKLNSLRSIVSFIVPPPNDAQSNGKTGNIAIDNQYFYICTEPNTWKRIPLTEI
jgi:hypothetical protein